MILVVGIGILVGGVKLWNTGPGTVGGRNVPLEQYSHSGNRNSGGGKPWKTDPGAAGGITIPFEQYSCTGKRDSGGGGKPLKTAPGVAGGENIPFEQFLRSGKRDSGVGGKPLKTDPSLPRAWQNSCGARPEHSRGFAQTGDELANKVMVSRRRNERQRLWCSGRLVEAAQPGSGQWSFLNTRHTHTVCILLAKA